MRRRPAVTILMLIIAVILTLPMQAQQKPVAPTFRSACADLKVSATTAGFSPAKPFTQEQVSNMVRAGLGDESGAKLIEQRGIDFAPAEDFMQSLKAAGASEAFLKALRAAKPPEPASAKKPLNQVQVFALLVGQVPSQRVTMLVEERGIDFEPTHDYLQEVRLAGGEDELISALKSAKVTKPVTVDPAAQARQTEVRQHVAHGAELAEKGRHLEAEREYRAALLLDSQNADVYMSLAYLLGQQKKWDDAESVERAALRLDLNNELAHAYLGLILEKRGDRQGALEEYRAAYMLRPQITQFKDDYERLLREVGAGPEQDKLQRWVGTWVFAGPITWTTRCGSDTLPVVSIPNFSFKVLAVLPSGEAAARVKHPRRADEESSDFYVALKPDWSGTATGTSLVINLNPIPSGTILFPSSKAYTLKEAAGRLEVHQEGGCRRRCKRASILPV